jgi:hypothetical protein
MSMVGRISDRGTRNVVPRAEPATTLMEPVRAQTEAPVRAQAESLVQAQAESLVQAQAESAVRAQAESAQARPDRLRIRKALSAAVQGRSR